MIDLEIFVFEIIENIFFLFDNANKAHGAKLMLCSVVPYFEIYSLHAKTKYNCERNGTNRRDERQLHNNNGKPAIF